MGPVARPDLAARFPLILMGLEYWKGLLKWMETLQKQRFISPGDNKLFTLTNDPEQAIEILLEYQRHVGVTPMVAKAVA